ncbi:MAG: tRNA (adenosine(37)-N6)-threonylcarbamoyltransferase complex ATPase subunit type 1 TsaE [Oscillospiraceae bacterium]|jgi:tRNA threonylcarbamoyladenosine biosynthesis protein TsaE|nr:tRNA (adenosine(37)-N6)-threonylcarbamoyltransferase complex ATPase subunit type 1 TsaE [Oscillospiraceae bacterium]
MREYRTFSPVETEALGERLAAGLKGGEVLALFGGMGMGKTALTRGIARGLGIPKGVCSPTFALVHEYRGRVIVYHFDMYRVTSWDDLASTGFFDDLNTGAVLVVEWSENIENALPEEAIRIHLSRGKTDNERVFSIEGMLDENIGN